MTSFLDEQNRETSKPTGPLDIHDAHFVLETFKRFVDGLPTHPSQEAIVRTVLRLAWPEHIGCDEELKDVVERFYDLCGWEPIA
jgi:hypothetical protein